MGLTQYQLIDGRVSVAHDRQVAVPHNHFDQSAHGHRAALPSVGKRVGDSDEPGDVLDGRSEDLEGDVFLRVKLVVHRGLADSDAVGDHLQ